MAARKKKTGGNARVKKSADKSDTKDIKKDKSHDERSADDKMNGNTEKQVVEDTKLAAEGDLPRDEDEEDEEDEDYDPNAAQESDSDLEAEEEKGEYAKVEPAAVSQVRTRFQRQNDAYRIGSGSGALVANLSNLDLDSIFNRLNEDVGQDEWKSMVTKTETTKPSGLHAIPSSVSTLDPADQLQLLSLEKDKIRIETTYTFAGKIITESKLVDADSAEAKVYQNSTDLINKSSSESMKGRRSFIPVIRTVPGETEPVALRIKLKRPSLIDKFLDTYLNKKLKLSTLEKSRLDWASFVDKKQIQDELRVANKAGFLDKQDFLNRVEWKRDEQYKQAKELDRQQKLREEQGH